MLALDAAARYGAVAVLLVLAFLGWQQRRHWPSAPYLVLACLSVSALLVGYAPPLLELPQPWLAVARFADIPHLVFVWLFALSLFERDFALRSWHILVGIAYAGPIFWPRLAEIGVLPPQPAWLPIYGAATSLLLIGHLVIVTIAGRSDDLLEQRRASRSTFVILLLVVTILAASADFLPADGAIGPRTAKVFAILPAIIFGAVWMLRLKIQEISAQNSGFQGQLRERDRALMQQLDQKLIEQRGFADPTLTISNLARDLGVSQHRLRALINGELGHANFSTFINGLRVHDVRRAMADPLTADLPVLTLAMDAGFQSLSPFNRAFKSNTGMTPTAYRAKLAQ